MDFPTRTAQVTIKDLTNSSPAEALKLARGENEVLVDLLQELSEVEQENGPANGQSQQSFDAGERVIHLSRPELLQVRRSLLAEVQINNAIIELAYEQVKGTN